MPAGTATDRMGGKVRWTASDAVLELMRRFLSEDWDKRNSRGDRLRAMNYSGFAHDLDVFTEAELDTDPFYTEFCRPLGFGWSAGTQIETPTRDLMVFSFDRRLERGPFERPLVDFLDTIRPHLARAGLLSARLRLEQARGVTNTLATLGLPAAVLGSDRRVIAANELLLEMIWHVRIGAFDRLQLVDNRADEQLAGAIRQIGNPGVGAILSVVMSAPENPMAIMHLVPIRGAGSDVFNDASAIAIVTPVAARPPQSEALLQGLFDLTPAETRVAHGLPPGATYGRSLGYETARWHLKAVLSKTGTHRQADLVALLAGISTTFPR